MKKAVLIIAIVVMVAIVTVGLLFVFGSEAGINILRNLPHNTGEISLFVNGEKIDIDDTEVEWTYTDTVKIKNGKFKFSEGSYGDNLFEYKIPGYEYVTVKFGIFNTNWWHINKYDINISVTDENDTIYVEAEEKVNTQGSNYTDKNSINIKKGEKTDLWIYLGP